MANFTKGPWIAGEDVCGESVRVGSSCYMDWAVAKVFNYAGPDENGNKVEAISNAKLIAAAPDMYEAGKALADLDYGVNGWTHACDMAAMKMRAALAKAEGK